VLDPLPRLGLRVVSRRFRARRRYLDQHTNFAQQRCWTSALYPPQPILSLKLLRLGS
jgi:hypothetical protein